MAAEILARAPARMRVAFYITIAIGLLLAMRLFYWQIVRGSYLNDLARKQQTVNLSIPAPRGKIITRDGVLLAQDIYLYTISISPSNISKKVEDRQKLAAQIAPLVHQAPDAILAKLNSNATTVVLATDVDINSGAAILELKNRFASKNPDLNAIIVDSRVARKYPADSFAAPVIGFVNSERLPANGLELAQNKYLQGKNGLLQGGANALHAEVVSFDSITNIAPVPGSDLVLSLDAGIQRAVEMELGNALKSLSATAGCAMVMDAKTGAMLGMASLPTADLNLYFDPATDGKFANNCVTPAYDPGSAFTMVTAAAALDAGTIAPATTFDDNGSFLVGSFTVTNHSGIAPGRVSLVDVFRQSLDVESAKMSVGLGVDRYYKFLQQFGLDSTTGIEIAGESVSEPRTVGDGKWRDTDLGQNAYGQSIGVTPIQLITAIDVLANQGKLAKPYLVAEIHAADGAITRTNPIYIRQVVRSDTARAMTSLLADAVNGEASNKAQIPGYRAAGMGGSTPYPVLGLIDPKIILATFVGYFPADDPQYVILVKLERPQAGDAGWQIAAPVFANIARQIAMITGLPPDATRLALK
jgi:cell division protein FtsI/penicillin-binding protein 2